MTSAHVCDSLVNEPHAITMNVTDFSKSLAKTYPKLQWPSIGADRLFSFSPDERCPRGDPVQLGLNLHKFLRRYAEEKSVPKDYEYICESIMDIFYELGIEDVEFEEAVEGLGLKGRADIIAIDHRQRRWVIEIKTTQSGHLEPPTASEIFQMATYTKLANIGEDPRIMCLRVNLRTRMVGVFLCYDAKKWVNMVESAVA